MEDERPLVVDLDELRQVLLRLLDVDVRVARVVKDAEEAVDADVDARRLQKRFVVRLDDDPLFLEQSSNRSVGKDHGAILRRRFLEPVSDTGFCQAPIAPKSARGCDELDY